MRFIQSNELNKKKWDELIQSSSYYSYSYFLDSVAKNWGVFVDEQYSKGVAICYNSVLGLKIIYPPFLGRTIEFINLTEIERDEVFRKILKEFKIGNLNTEDKLSTKIKFSSRVYQCINAELKQNTLSKRMLKKAQENKITTRENNFEDILEIVNEELSSKVKELTLENQNRLKNFIKSANQEEKLISLGIFNAKQILDGGLFFFESDEKITYITGACKNDSRNAGGMYLGMINIMQLSQKKNKILDFGGSNIESIRRFYCSIGGEDHEYFSYQWNKAPFWFNWIRLIKKRF